MSLLALAEHGCRNAVGDYRGHQTSKCQSDFLSRLIIVRPCTTTKSHPWPKQTANGFDADLYFQIGRRCEEDNSFARATLAKQIFSATARFVSDILL